MVDVLAQQLTPIPSSSPLPVSRFQCAQGGFSWQSSGSHTHPYLYTKPIQCTLLVHFGHPRKTTGRREWDANTGPASPPHLCRFLV